MQAQEIFEDVVHRARVDMMRECIKAHDDLEEAREIARKVINEKEVLIHRAHRAEHRLDRRRAARIRLRVTITGWLLAWIFGMLALSDWASVLLGWVN